MSGQQPLRKFKDSHRQAYEELYKPTSELSNLSLMNGRTEGKISW